MCQSTKTRRKYQPRPLPADVAVEWLTLPQDGDPTLSATVLLNDTVYAFSAWIDGPTGAVLGYRFARQDGRMHDVDTDGVCDCEDCTYRQRQCKHSYAVQYLLACLPDARQAQLDAEQQADQGDVAPWYSDEELDAMYRESLEEDAVARGLCFYDEPELCRFGIGA